ncbi:MAG: Ig-like domain-containing protein [Rubrobacteraceae bacterium]
MRLREGTEFEGGAQIGSNGTWSARLTGVSDGSHTYVAEAVDKAGNVSPASNALTVIVDATPPDTTIDSGPSGAVNSTTAGFGFSSEAGATFECRLLSLAENAPGVMFSGCSSPREYTALADGPYTFEVRAADALNHTDASPADRTFTVDTI